MKANQSSQKPIKGLPVNIPSIHAPYLKADKPKLQKKGDWRAWKEKSDIQEKQIEALERKLKEAEYAPTHIWRRIRIYWIGDENHIGKLCTVRSWASGTNYRRIVRIFGNRIKYTRYSYLYDEGSDRIRTYRTIELQFGGNRVISYDNSRKFFKRIRVEKVEEGEECCCSG